MTKVFVVSYIGEQEKMGGIARHIIVDSVWTTEEFAHERAEQLVDISRTDVNVQARVLGE